jgi:hypothetical protein
VLIIEGKYKEAIDGLIWTFKMNGPMGSFPKFISDEKLRVPGKYLVIMLR